MSGSGFGAVRAALLGWPTDVVSTAGLDGAHRRLLDALHGLQTEPRTTGRRDVASLVRQVLRSESEHQGVDQHLVVPTGTGWPTESEWAEAGCLASPAEGSQLLVSATRWSPSWITTGGLGLGSAAERAEVRRPQQREYGDPFLADVLGPGFAEYSSMGQKQAVRTVLAAAPGSTVIVNLPTGSGKSAVAIAPALLHSLSGGVSVLVVPTTSLALDQERALRSHIAETGETANSPAGFAYYGGLADSDREAIRRAIRDGTQRLVITSPESLVTSLAPSLHDAASMGHLRYFAVDEAHTVASWGVEFRPEFQALSGFRQELLRAASGAQRFGFKTLLLSATITEEALDTLVVLFGNPGPIEYIASSSVRPEPEYWMAEAPDEVERRDRVVEALRHLPRPAIVYTSRPGDAEQLATAVRADGSARVTVVTGATTPSDRMRAILRWRGDRHADGPDEPRTEVDIVVGTSAFGLGVDQSDVRSVIHACLPESIDRFYQEVGRGGRDGRASTSLLVHTSSDVRIAESLGNTKVIGVELGLERWEAMILNATALGEDRYRVSLDAKRGTIVQNSRENQAWNLRTLAIMMRAGLLQLEGEAPPSLASSGDNAIEAAFEQYVGGSVVRIVHPGHRDPDTWAQLVEPARRRTMRSSQEAFALMKVATSGVEDLATVFSRAFTIESSSGLGARGRTIPQPACGGCPNCRANMRAPYSAIPVAPEGPREPALRVSETLAGIVDSLDRPLVVLIDAAPIRTRGRWPEFTELLTALVRHGVRLLSASPQVLALHGVDKVHRKTRDGFLFVEPNPPHIFAPRVPALVVHDPADPKPVVPAWYFRPSSRPQVRVILLPTDARDPERPDRLVSELRHPSLGADTLLSML